MKKLISLLLTLAMVLSLAVPALAAEPAVTGNQSGEVSGTYNPTVTVTGVSLIVDGTTYTEGDVTITPDSTVTLTVTGTNLQYGTNDHRVQFASGMNVPIISDYFTFSDDGTTATWDATASNFSNSSNHEIVYYIDYTSDNRTPISTGIYVTYDSGTAPDTKTIYFDNTEGWSTVYAYAWSSDPNTEYLGEWPGSAMTKVEGTESIYAIEVPTDAVNVIFNNGSGGTGSQTSDQTIPTDDKNLYTYSTNEWSVYGGTTEPTVEAKWGTSVDNLTGSGTLAEAIAAAADDSGITYIQLQSDVTTENGYLIESGVFTLDLNGKTLSSAAYTLTVRNSGTEVTLTDSATGGAVTTTGEVYAAVGPVLDGKVVFNGGSYSGGQAINLMAGGIAEIHGGTFTGTYGYAVSDDANSTLSIAGGTFSGPWAPVTTSGTTTITRGTLNGGSEGQISYCAGTLDLSGYDAVNGLTLSQWTNADLTVSDENIKLPAGYVFQDSEGTTVTTLAHETVYTIAAENAKPTYTITVDKYGEGTVEVPATAAEGETVTVTLNPAEGYTALNFQIKQTDNYKEVDFTKVNDTTYTFVMPAVNVVVFANFCLPGTKLDTVYYKGPWTNVRFEFINSAGFVSGTAAGTLKEAGIYAGTPVPEWSYSLIIRNLEDTAQYIDCGSIPTDGSNMYNAETEQWKTYTPSQPPEEVASAEITWGSMAFTYSDEQVTLPDGTTGDKGWSTEGSDKAGTVTVENTGTTTVTVSAIYTPETAYAEITGTMGEEKTLAAAESGTFTLTLTGKPGKAIPADTKIGTVTVTIK